MKISVHIAMWLSLAFAVLCITYGIVGLTSLDASATATTREDAHGFAMFWLFLGLIGLVSAVGSWWMLRTGTLPRDE